ncbi:UNVERIFIED_CONTAM: hypothetical protein GTU68_020578 [Idotea baltica]|nr:hypothetical protein [Idotea baltica]
MALGELTNFVAYIFAPAILVTPLGVFSIVCTATLSPYFLKERLNTVGKLGCLLVLVGCVIVTLCGPKDREVRTMEELEAQLMHPGFLIYASIVVGVSLFLMALVPRYGHRYVLLYITICSSFGSLSVMFCKGVGLAIKETIGGHNEFRHWATWVCLVCLVGCLLIETVFMQRALDLFNSSVFMSVNYVLFTSLVIVASSILYTELRVLGWKNILLTILGFVVNIVALFMLHLDKEEEAKEAQGEEEAQPEGGAQPDQGPETPLMTKNNNNIVGGKDVEASRGSPLSGIGLSPGFFGEAKKGTKFLSFLRSESHSDQSQSRGEEEPPRSPLSRSSLSCNEACSYSSRSNLSDNSSLGTPDEDLPNAPTEGGTRQSLCEVPLITELQSSSRLGPGAPLPERNFSFSSPLQEEAQGTFLKRSRPSSELFSDADDDTQLV